LYYDLTVGIANAMILNPKINLNFLDLSKTKLLMQDTLSWIEKQRRGRAREQTVATENKEYENKELVGLTVSNDLEDFEMGKDHVLVLKDSDILKDEQDVLELEQYKTSAMHEDEEGKSIGFKIHHDVPKIQEKSVVQGISLVVEKKIVQDQDLVIKKRKHRKNKREKDDFSLQELKTGTNKKKIIGDFVDDDDLQEFISKARIKKLEKKGAEYVKNSVMENEHSESLASDSEEKGMVISEATEFVRGLGAISGPKQDLEEIKEERNDLEEIKEERNDLEEIKEERNDLEEIKEERNDLEEIKEERKVHFEDMDVDVKEEVRDTEEDEGAFHAEPLVSAGLGATLALLSQKGLVQRLSPEEQERANKLRERELWLVEQRKREKIRIVENERERESQRTAGRKLSGRELERQREADAKRLEREQIKLKEEKFKNYVPDVKIAYYDEFGRELNTKEVSLYLKIKIQAYKQLAQKFHGHMPGKKKAEKRLQRIEDERKAKQAESRSLNTAQVVSEAMKQTGNAYLTLSVGNRA
jgi:U4/U6.U5 tri-snRNP-associated protein 1